jgi:hypothetical protein
VAVPFSRLGERVVSWYLYSNFRRQALAFLVANRSTKH